MRGDLVLTAEEAARAEEAVTAEDAVRLELFKSKGRSCPCSQGEDRPFYFKSMQPMQESRARARDARESSALIAHAREHSPVSSTYSCLINIYV